MNLLKVWLYLIDNKEEVIKTSAVAEELNLSKDSVTRAKRDLEKDMHAIISKKKAKIAENGWYCCLGSSITLNAWVDD